MARTQRHPLGTAAAYGAAATNYQTLLVSRASSSASSRPPSARRRDAHQQPSGTPKSESAPRLSFWYCGLGVGQIVGGAVSYGFQEHGPDARLAGWRTMFVVLGLLTVLVGGCVVLFLPDTPMQAKWLGDDEKVALLGTSASTDWRREPPNLVGRRFSRPSMDPRSTSCCRPSVLVGYTHRGKLSSPAGSWNTRRLRQALRLERRRHHVLGHPHQEPGLRPQAGGAHEHPPSGVVSIFFTLLVGYGIRRTLAPLGLGSSPASSPPSSAVPSCPSCRRATRSGILAGIYLVNAVVAPLAVFYNVSPPFPPLAPYHQGNDKHDGTRTPRTGTN